MKFGLAFFVVIAFGFMSCHKDYQCVCEYEYTGIGHAPNAKETITMRDSKKGAEEKCAAKSQVYVNENEDTTYVNCAIY